MGSSDEFLGTLEGPLLPRGQTAVGPSDALQILQTRARRQLFGPIDHELLEKTLQVALRGISDSKRERWNFDFERREPLSGRYEWSLVPPAGSVSEDRLMSDGESEGSEHSETSPSPFLDSEKKEKTSRFPKQRTIQDFGRLRKAKSPADAGGAKRKILPEEQTGPVKKGKMFALTAAK